MRKRITPEQLKAIWAKYAKKYPDAPRPGRISKMPYGAYRTPRGKWASGSHGPATVSSVESKGGSNGTNRKGQRADLTKDYQGRIYWNLAPGAVGKIEKANDCFKDRGFEFVRRPRSPGSEVGMVEKKVVRFGQGLGPKFNKSMTKGFNSLRNQERFKTVRLIRGQKILAYEN